MRQFVDLDDDSNGGAEYLIVVERGTPCCLRHGAMNKVSASGVWRCLFAGCRVACKEIEYDRFVQQA
jgi:hypothetical protein